MGRPAGDHRGMDVTLHLAQDPEADEFLGRSPLAALVGMLLDQQVPMEWAFKGPWTIAQRLGADDLDAHEIAAADPESFAALLSTKPAVHRYPGSMAKRIQQLCQYLVDHYDGDASAVWQDATTGEELLSRLESLPGFGHQKAQIFLALLGKQLGVHPTGWREAAGFLRRPRLLPLRGRHQGPRLPGQGPLPQTGNEGSSQSGEGLRHLTTTRPAPHPAPTTSPGRQPAQAPGARGNAPGKGRQQGRRERESPRPQTHSPRLIHGPVRENHR